MSRERNGEFDPRRARRHVLWFSVGLFAAVALVMSVLIQRYGFETIRDGWDRIRPTVIAVKWGGMVVLIWQWEAFIRWLAQRQRLSDGYRDFLAFQRWRVAIALVILELLFGQNLLAHVLP